MALTANRVRHIPRLAVTLAAVWAPAPAGGPAPEAPEPGCVVRQVVMPIVVPVDDIDSEARQMAVAAALGVALTFAATRLRRPRSRRPPATGVVDITDVVQSKSP